MRDEATDFVWIERKRDLEQLAKVLDGELRIAIDTESDGFQAYQSKICLIQIATPHRTYLVDTVALPPDALSPLAGVLENPRITKVMHGADNDISGLKRDFGFSLYGLFDTLLAARYLGLAKCNLAYLMQNYFNVRTDKRFQRFDWSIRPLPVSALEYAAGDVLYLLALHDRFIEALTQRGWLDAVLQDSHWITQRDCEQRAFDPNGFWKIKGTKDLTLRQLTRLRELYLFRHRLCLAENRAAIFVLDNLAMLQMAIRPPRTIQELHAIPRINKRTIHHYGSELLHTLRQADQQAPVVEYNSSSDVQFNKAQFQVTDTDLYQDLCEWRKKAAQRDQIEIDLVATSKMLKQIAQIIPKSPSDLLSIPELTPWRIERYGNIWLQIVQLYKK
jgi:ribonuclease D